MVPRHSRLSAINILTTKARTPQNMEFVLPSICTNLAPYYYALK